MDASSITTDAADTAAARAPEARDSCVIHLVDPAVDAISLARLDALFGIDPPSNLVVTLDRPTPLRAPQQILARFRRWTPRSLDVPELALRRRLTPRDTIHLWGPAGAGLATEWSNRRRCGLVCEQDSGAAPNAPTPQQILIAPPDGFGTAAHDTPPHAGFGPTHALPVNVAALPVYTVPDRRHALRAHLGIAPNMPFVVIVGGFDSAGTYPASWGAALLVRAIPNLRIAVVGVGRSTIRAHRLLTASAPPEMVIPAAREGINLCAAADVVVVPEPHATARAAWLTAASAPTVVFGWLGADRDAAAAALLEALQNAGYPDVAAHFARSANPHGLAAAMQAAIKQRFQLAAQSESPRPPAKEHADSYETHRSALSRFYQGVYQALQRDSTREGQLTTRR